jgi:hypothetical protein
MYVLEAVVDESETHLLGVFDTFAGMCEARDAAAAADAALHAEFDEYRWAVASQTNLCHDVGLLKWTRLVTPRDVANQAAREAAAVLAARKQQQLDEARQRERDSRAEALRALVERAGARLSPAAPISVLEHVNDALADLDSLAHPERPFYAEKLPALRRKLAWHAHRHKNVCSSLDGEDAAALDSIAQRLQAADAAALDSIAQRLQAADAAAA